MIIIFTSPISTAMHEPAILGATDVRLRDLVQSGSPTSPITQPQALGKDPQQAVPRR
jgi:hypothetical protein